MDIRPAGFSDDENSDEDDDYFDSPCKKRTNIKIFVDENCKRDTEVKECIKLGDVEKFQKILQNDFQNVVDSRLSSGWTLLLQACLEVQYNIVKYLLDNNADPNLHCDSVTPLMALCSNDTTDDETLLRVLYILLEKGALLNLGDKYGLTPLMRIVKNGRITIVKDLLKQHINVEMRDQQGWTAAFWAVQYNHANILKLLIEHGCRTKEVDRYGRTMIDIAEANNYIDIVNILEPDRSNDIDKDEFILNNNYSWQDYYPGLSQFVPTYQFEIPNLLYGMNCERLTSIIMKSNIDLKTFLLLEEDDMIRLGIDMPFERRRLSIGLKKFHVRMWKIDSVAALYAQNDDGFSVVSCVTALGSHLYQMYILDATIQYAIRSYKRITNRTKYESEDSSHLKNLNSSANEIVRNIARTKKELGQLRNFLQKISSNNPPAPEFIRRPKTSSSLLSKMANKVITGSILTAVVITLSKTFRFYNLIR